MGVAFISKVLELFGQIFMKFWNLPMADLGFNLGTFVVFILLIKFAMSVFLNIDIQPVSTSGTVKQSYRNIKGSSKFIGKKIAKVHSKRIDKLKEKNKKQGKFKGGAGGNKFTGTSSGWGVGN